jgi:TolA-binding protein
MKFSFLLCTLACVAVAAAAPQVSVDELAMAQAEAKAYREAWLELKRRDQVLGLSALSPEVHDTQDKVARLSGELISAQKDRQTLLEKAKLLVEAASKWGNASEANAKSVARAEFESAKRAWLAATAAGEARPLASGVTDAQVVAVDRKQQALVLNLGRVQGAREGMPFRILRGDKVIGSCRLIEVRELVSAGMTEQLYQGTELKVGDRAAILAEK